MARSIAAALPTNQKRYEASAFVPFLVFMRTLAQMAHRAIAHTPRIERPVLRGATERFPHSTDNAEVGSPRGGGSTRETDAARCQTSLPWGRRWLHRPTRVQRPPHAVNPLGVQRPPPDDPALPYRLHAPVPPAGWSFSLEITFDCTCACQVFGVQNTERLARQTKKRRLHQEPPLRVSARSS